MVTIALGNQKPIKLLLAREEQHRRANNGSIHPRLYGKFLSEKFSIQSTEALLRLILLEQRTNFEKVNSTLTKLNNTLDAPSTVMTSILEFQRHHQ